MDKQPAAHQMVGSMFSKCDPEFLKEIVANSKLEVFLPGQVVLIEGTGKPSLRIVLKGSVEVLSQGKSVRFLESGEHYGEEQLLGVLRPAPETLRARTVVEMQVLSRKALFETLRRNPRKQLILEYLAVSCKLQHQLVQCNGKVGVDGEAKELMAKCSSRQLEVQRELEVQHGRLEQILGLGQMADNLSQGSLMRVGGDAHADMHTDIVPGSVATIFPERRMVLEEDVLPGRWPSLSDWQKQLAASAKVTHRRLYCGAPPLGMQRPNTVPACMSRASGSASRCSRLSPSLPPREPSPQSLTEIAPSLQQPPYPRMPHTARRCPPSLRSRRLKASGPNAINGGRNRQPCSKADVSRLRGVPAALEASECIQKDVSPSPAFSPIDSAKQPMPPGFGEAVGDLAQVLLRSEWHVANLVRAQSTSPVPPWEELLGAPSTAHGQTSQGSAVAAVRGLSSELVGPPVQAVPQLGLVTPLTPGRRLEITLRGTFRQDQIEEHSGSDPGGAAKDDEVRETNSSATSASCWSESEATLRARMGFGMDEAGATPSGRSSVPAIRSGTACGTLSPSSLSATVDEGLELSSLADIVEHYIIRLLERSIRAGEHSPSRGASCDLPSCDPSPRASPCPSPFPTGLTEELNLRVSVRLCHSRCGSSSAVLELLLDHGPECNEACGCRCWPTPEDAAARLRAHFARHSMRRLVSSHPPVRVLLESLDSNEETNFDDSST